ncbi:tannase and feruloyl esterase-domain-containing protein [Mycena vulgaris]|nr:tannase and feruloyl esterase-domain-containing protein [Mycena vulgaris]
MHATSFLPAGPLTASWPPSQIKSRDLNPVPGVIGNAHMRHVNDCSSDGTPQKNHGVGNTKIGRVAVKHYSEKGVGQIKFQGTVGIESLYAKKPRRQFQSGSPMVSSDTTSARGSDSTKQRRVHGGIAGRILTSQWRVWLQMDSPNQGSRWSPRSPGTAQNWRRASLDEKAKPRRLGLGICTRQVLDDIDSIAAPTNVTAAPPCRVYFVINTTDTSVVHAEAWLPDTWYGRFLGLGNGGLNGCIEYVDLDYGASLHFASVGSDNGPAQWAALPQRSRVHIEAIFGKQLVAAYYNTPAAKSYFLGCSTGGRQGTQAALRFPEDSDGIIAGSPPTDFNDLSGWDGLLGHYIGAVDTDSSAKAEASPKFITPELWAGLSAEILRQCDELDGLVDGIIVEPDDCDFQPDMLLCESNSTANQTTGCLTQVQVEVLKNIYSPLFGADGQLLYPRYSPGAEANPLAASIFGGTFLQLTAGWKRYAILNVIEHDFTNFSVQDIALFDAINPGGVATFDGDMSAFRERGGKFIIYHGRRDPLISLTNSKRVCDLISHTLSLPPAQMDDFYRVLLIPGMGHCFSGVDWIEGGAAPATIIGSDKSGAERTHCRLTPPLKLNPSA